MRKIIVLVTIVLGFFTCKNEPKNYVTLSGTITNHQADTLYITDGRIYKKPIKINQDGSFIDTLNVETGDYRFNYGDEYGIIYLKNDNISSLNFNYKDFHNSLEYGGDDADINNFAIQNYRLINKYFSPDMAFDVTKEDIDSAIYNFKIDYEKLKLMFKNVDSLHIANNNIVVEKSFKSVEYLYTSKLALESALPKGSPSPLFENYKNYNGGTTSLSDFKGKYVYLIFWTTWHNASKKYLTSLEQLVLKYKNIEFVCISLDDARTSGSLENAKKTWRKSINDNKFAGIHLFAENGWKSDFVEKYLIKATPRFVLIDQDGNVISADAPSPSNPKLIELFNSLKI